MRNGDSNPEQAVLRRWVATWRVAGFELAEVAHRELAATDTREAIRQIFGGRMPAGLDAPSTTSGLVEQQAYFSRLRK